MRSRSVNLMRLGTAGVLLAWIPVLSRRAFDPDELEHSHAAWCLFKGMLPYKDFFEHHTPWYYYVLRPLFNWFPVDTSFDGARHFLLAGRVLSLLFTIVSVALVWWIGRRAWQDRRVGPLAGLLLVSQPIFFQKAVEIRPDVLALPFFLGGLALLLRGLEPGAESPRSALRWFLAAGLGVGAGVMCTQKVLFVLPGTLVGLGVWAVAAGASGRRVRLLSIAVFLLGVLLPGALTWAVFASQGGGRAFIVNNFLVNAAWKHFATNQFVRLLETSAPVLALAIVGLSVSLGRFLDRSEARRYGQLVLIGAAVGLFAALPAMPSAHRQYYLPALPIVCLCAASGLLWIVAWASDRARPWLTGVAAAGLAVLPFIALREASREPNDAQLARLRTVFEITRPTDLVMDGWEGLGVFRPHAFFYYFLHNETRAMLPRARLDAYLDALESGRVRPKLIALDGNLVALGPRFVGFVLRNYVRRDELLFVARNESN